MSISTLLFPHFVIIYKIREICLGGQKMTKKGIVLSVILVILLITIAIILFKHNYIINDNQNKPNTDLPENQIITYTSYETGFDLEELKKYGLPILIQIGTSQNEDCIRMKNDIEELNKEIKGKVIIKFLDIKNYKEILNIANDSIKSIPTQVFINSDGTPLKSAGSELFGYKEIKNENGEHIYTIHEGDLTKEEMKELLVKMGMK